MPTTVPHTVSSYDDDLHRLRAIVGQMGALGESQLTGALDALRRRDAEAAAAVVALDARIDGLHDEADRTAVAVFARHAPLAEDLREVLAAFRTAGWLERVGDYSKTIARRAGILAGLDAIPVTAEVEQLATLVRNNLRMAMTAQLDRNLGLATATIDGDVAIDAEYARVFAAIIRFAEANPAATAAATHLQFIAKNLERIADQATNIAEQVAYALTGETAAPRDTSGAA